MPELLIRAMRPADLPAVFALQCRAYPADYHEPVEAFASRLVAGSEHCFVAERAGQLVGYVFAHPWAGEPPRLHLPLRPSDTADHVFLHDMAVDPACRGMASGKLLHDAVLESLAGRGFSAMQLVAVGAARRFWQGLGWHLAPEQSLPACYGESVRMTRGLI